VVRDRVEPGPAREGQAAQEEVSFPLLLFCCVLCVFLTDVCRLKQLREGPYTHEEANAAVSYRIDNGPERTKTQEVEMS